MQSHYPYEEEAEGDLRRQCVIETRFCAARFEDGGRGPRMQP